MASLRAPAAACRGSQAPKAVVPARRARTVHGFGLHGSALQARELGGDMVASSDGLGHGATFTLTVPLKRVGEYS